MDQDGWGFAADALLRIESRLVLGDAGGNDTIPAASGPALPAIFPAFVLPPAALAAAPDSVAGSLTFADPQSFAMPEPPGSGLLPAVLPAAPEPPPGGLAVVEQPMPAGAVTAVLHDGTTLSFADFAGHAL